MTDWEDSEVWTACCLFFKVIYEELNLVNNFDTYLNITTLLLLDELKLKYLNLSFIITVNTGNIWNRCLQRRVG